MSGDGIMYYVTLNILPSAAVYRAGFREKMDCLFGVFSSTKYKVKDFGKPFSTKSN